MTLARDAHELVADEGAGAHVLVAGVLVARRHVVSVLREEVLDPRTALYLLLQDVLRPLSVSDSHQSGTR